MGVVIPVSEICLSEADRRIPYSIPLSEFNNSVKPVIVGEPGGMIVDTAELPCNFYGCVKAPDDRDIKIPDGYEGFEYIVRKAVIDHYSEGYSIDDTCILQIERTFVSKEFALRSGGIHVDGHRVDENNVFNFIGGVNYLATSSLSPYFYDLSFER